MKLQDIIKNNQSLDFDFLQNDKELARQIQIRLIDLGLLQGTASGAYGPITKASLTRFTQAFNLPSEINPQVAKRLIEAKLVPGTQTPSSQTCSCGDLSNVSDLGVSAQSNAPLLAKQLPLPGIELIKQFEGCCLEAYPDPLTGNKPITIGWGSTKKWDGSEWKLGDRITQQQADELFTLQLVQEYLPDLQKIPCWNELNVNQQGALLSFAYNLGKSFFGSPNFQTITKVLQDRDWGKIKDAFLLYRNPGSIVEEGLKRRRLAEAALFSTPV